MIGRNFLERFRRFVAATRRREGRRRKIQDANVIKTDDSTPRRKTPTVDDESGKRGANSTERLAKPFGESSVRNLPFIPLSLNDISGLSSTRPVNFYRFALFFTFSLSTQTAFFRYFTLLSHFQLFASLLFQADFPLVKRFFNGAIAGSALRLANISPP